jgi:outer membrane protein
MKKIIGTIVASTLLLGATAFASIKVGIIDLPQILQHSPQVQAISTKLKAQFKPEQEKIMAAQNKIRTEAQKLSPNKTDAMKPAEKKAIQDKIMAEQKKLQQMVVNFQEGVGKAQESAMRAFMDQVDTAVKTIAQKDGLDLVLLKPAVVYASDTVDVTKQVLAVLPKKN